MVRSKRRYILVYAPNLTKEECKERNLYLVERDGEYCIVRCYLSDLDNVRDMLNKEGMVTLTTSGTLKALRSRKEIIKHDTINNDSLR